MLLLFLAALVLVPLSACGRPTEQRRITITLADDTPAFSVATLTFTKGQKVNLRVDNDTDDPQGFSIDAYRVHEVVQPHRPVRVRFTADRVGTFGIYDQLLSTDQRAQEAHLLVVE